MARPAPTQSTALSVSDTEAGVDWLTLLCEYRRDQEAALEVADAARAEDEGEGHKAKPWRWLGYEGWMTPSVRVGWMRGGLCLQSSGAAADILSTRLPSSCGRVSRLDVQTTIRLSASAPQFGTRFLRRVATTRRPPQQSLPRRSQSTDTDGLWLGTVGRRTAPRYIRVYDKGVESKCAPQGTLWRVEVEAKQGLGQEIWDRLRKAEDSASFCMKQCRAQLLSAGCCWPSIVQCDKQDAIRSPRPKEPTAYSLITWYRSGVAPTLPQTLSVFSVREVLEALDLIHLAAPREELAHEC